MKKQTIKLVVLTSIAFWLGVSTYIQWPWVTIGTIMVFAVMGFTLSIVNLFRP